MRALFLAGCAVFLLGGEAAAQALSGPGVPTPVSVANGGTGATTLTGLLVGNGTSAVTGAGACADLSNDGTMCTQNANNVAITGGAIDGTTIGGTTRAAVNATTLNTNSDTTMGDAPTDVTTIHGHLTVNSDGTGPTLSSCGTSPSLASASSDLAGLVTVGTGSPTTCVVTFANAYPQRVPSCVITPYLNGTAIFYISNITDSSFTVSGTVGIAAGTGFFYHCIGRREP